VTSRSNGRLAKRTIAPLVAGLVGVVAIIGCSSSPSSNPSSNPGSSASGGDASKTFTIPVFTSESGATAPYGAENRVAYTAAINDINGAGGIDGYKLALKYYDDQGSPTTATQAFLGATSNAIIAAGPDVTIISAALFPLAKAAKLPIVNAGVSSTSVIATGRPYAFVAVPPDIELVPNTVKQWLAGNTAVHTVGILYDSENSGSASQTSLILDALKSDGTDVGKVVTAQSGQPTYQAEANALASSNPDGAVVCGLTADAAAMVHALRSANFKGPILLCHAAAGSTTIASLLGNVSGVVDGIVRSSPPVTEWQPGRPRRSPTT
jgi:branched-chain amino acid transport system substrate-binding protein